MNPAADQSPKGGDPQGLHAKHASGGDAKRQAQKTGTVDLEKRLEALLEPEWSHEFDLPVADLKAILTQLREYRTALEARPAMPEREAIARVREIETVTGDFFTEPGTPFYRIEIDGYCADFDHREAAENFAAAINRAALPTTGDVREAAPEREEKAEPIPSDPDEAMGWRANKQGVSFSECRFSGGRLERWRAGHKARSAWKKGIAPDLASPPSAHDMRWALERQTGVVDRLCSAIERAEQDIGGETIAEVLRELGPANDHARAALASSPMDAVKAAVEAEREACAKVAEHIGRTQNGYTYEGYANDIAQAIRARAGGAK